MKKIIYILVLITLVPMLSLKAQYAYFPQEGIITFEKTVHTKNLIRRHMNTLKDGDFTKSFYQDIIGKVAETTVLKKKLSFKGNEVNWEPIKETLDPVTTNLLNAGLLDYQNTVYQNFDTGESQSTFEMGGSNVFIKDSLLNIKWKITNEYRQIAGYDCRRANGVTLDSVYIVAFFTDQIPVSGGPSNIHGLPGMILGLVVNEQHFNIYATKVEFNAPVIKNNVAGRRANPQTREQVKESLTTTLKNFLSMPQINLLLAGMML